MRPSYGSAQNRKLLNKVGCIKKVEVHLHCPEETGRKDGLSFDSPGSCTLRMTVKKNSKGHLKYDQPSK